LAIGGSQHPSPLQDQINLRGGSMASSLAPAPAPVGYPPHGNQAPPGYPPHGNQAPLPQHTAVTVTAASNGAGNPYVLVTPASAAPSTCHCE
jgi:hypothetical protein